MWGDEDANAASVGYEDETKNAIEWLQFRIDARDVSIDFVRGICDLTGQWKCLLLTRQYHLLRPDTEIVLAAIKSSTAKHFVEDPVSTLQALKRDQGEIIQLPNKTDLPPKE